MGDRSTSPADRVGAVGVSAGTKNIVDAKKLGLQTLIQQLNDSVSLIAKEVAELQCENVELKCQLDAYKLPVVVEPPPCSSALCDDFTGSATDQKVGHDGDLVPTTSAASSTCVAAEARVCFEDDLQMAAEGSEAADPSTIKRVANTQLHQFFMRAQWAQFKRYRNVRLMLPRGVAKIASLARDDKDIPRSWCVVDPNSRYRLLWVLGCVVLLLYDVFVVPMNVCFDMKDTSFSKTVDMISMVYWSSDIPLTFLTGFFTKKGDLEMRLYPIAVHYARGWLLFDILIVLPEYLTLLFADFPGAGSVSVFRIVRWGRLMRILRLARVARASKLKAALRYLAIRLHLSKMYVELSHHWLSLNLMLPLSMHIMACLWYAFGNMFDRGWIVANNLETADVGRLYAASLCWNCRRLFGIFSGHRLETVPELVMDSLLTLLSLATIAMYLGTGSAVVNARAHSQQINLWKSSLDYIGRHNISPTVAMRLKKSLEASHYLCAGEIAADEHRLLDSLPPTIREDLIFESRFVVMLGNVFFTDMSVGYRRTLREVCNAATDSHVLIQSEVIFDDGDSGRYMRIIQSGAFTYTARSGAHDHRLTHQSIVSEAVLWVNWLHVGKMQALEEATFLTVDSIKFSEVIMEHEKVCIHAFRYAKHFVWRLNHEQNINDLICFNELNWEQLNEDLFDGTSHDHFVFISHYKQEAGTEATLIRDHLEPILLEDQAHPASNFEAPIFIDSEDLIDLSRLKAHVEHSHTLMILLTPGLFSRPWCLVEIVTAVRFNVNIVPVEVQRPGSRYSYPDEQFYKSIVDGSFLDRAATDLLKQEGIQLEEVAEAIGQVCLKISLPFSPHKTKVVREAELHDILKRCNHDLEGVANTGHDSLL